jgi:pimeloyl-ACP methyl ester carboxylesterase
VVAKATNQHITDSGGDGASIILLHGYMASRLYWRKVTPFLVAKGYRVIGIDLLGFGDAPKPQHSTYDYLAHVQHIRQAIVSLRLKSFVLVGHSLGGLVAARYANLYPEAIKKVVLLHPPLYRDSRQVIDTLLATGLHYRLLLGDVTKLNRLAWKVVQTVIPDIRAHTVNSRHLSMRHVVWKAELIKDLQSTSVPTLIIIGTKDRRIYQRNSSLIEQLDSVKVVAMPWSHHSALRKATDVAQLISRYHEVII